MGEHRVPMLGAALRRRRDPANSHDPTVRRVVAALHGLEVAPAPRAEFRDELRAQLVAVAPRLVAEGKAELRTAGAADATGRAARRSTADATERSKWHFKRPLLAVTGVLAAFILLLGGAVVLSRHALPGDALYGLKRASENTEYSLAGGSIDRGKLKLQFAATRIKEVEQLLDTPTALGPGVGAMADSGAISSSTAKLVRQTLGSANGDILTASQLLTGFAVNTRKDGALSVITGWRPDQARAMHRITARVQGTDLARPARHTASLINRMAARAGHLKAELHCSCLDPARSDQFGPKPCRGACSAPAHRHGSSGNSPRSGSSSGGKSSGGKSGGTPRSSGAPQPAPSGGSSAPRRGGGSSGSRGGSVGASSGPAQPNSSSGSKPRLPLPSSALPSLPSVPVSSAPLPGGGSLCITLSIGSIGVPIGC